ncbi:MAG: hypothetical protein AAGD18_01305 [Actinomycetota bacterium]
MKQRFARALVLVAVTMAAVVAMPTAASAHEFGPFAIDRYVAILAGPDGLEVDYVLDLAETPTQADGDRIEADPVGYCDSLADSIDLGVDGRLVDLDAPTASILRQDGDGGLTTLRIECGWTVPLGGQTGPSSVTFDDGNFTERVGWREIVVVGDRALVTGDVSDSSITTRLTDFPDPDENPRTEGVAFDVELSDDVGPAELDDSRPGEDDGGSGDMFSNLIADADGGVWSMIAALGLAALLGALHSLAPGHGKSVIGAYLVGTRGTKIQALILATAVALSHTLGVLVLGIITYLAGAAFAPENVYPWLQALSAVIVLGIGIWLVVMALREAAVRRAEADGLSHGHRGHSHHGHDHGHHDHDDHSHDHGHHDHGDHSHDHDHAHHDHGHHGHDHGHAHHDQDHEDRGLFGAAAATFAAGTAVAAPHDPAHDHGGRGHGHPNDHDGHSHGHDGHSHDHDGHSHGHDGHDHDHDGHSHGHDGHDHDHSHDHGSGWHRHGIFPHTHKYDLDDLDLTGKVSWKTLALLGLSGGLVPSTSAIIVLLGAIQLNRIAFGGLLILAFGIGMAVALISVGLGMVALRDRMFGAMEGNEIIATARRVIVPLAACAVLVVGIFLVVRAGVVLSDT